MKFNLSHYGYMYGCKDIINAPDSHVVNVSEERCGVCSYFVFYSEADGNIFFFWYKGFMKDYRRLRSDRVLLHITNKIELCDKLRHNFSGKSLCHALRFSHGTCQCAPCHGVCS